MISKKGDKYMLTPRLECIAKYVNTDTAADIGTDHAYIPVDLIKKGRARHVIASDVRKGPLRSAETNIEKNGLSDRIELRLGSGLSVLKPGEADVIIIAGMGGILISEIIAADIETASGPELILQPMNSQYELRKWLIENGFRILCEDIECEEHHVYNIIKAEKGVQKPYKKDISYHIPPELYGHPKLKFLYEKKMREFSKIVNGLETAENCDRKKLEYYRMSLKELKEIEKYVG